MTGRIPFSDTTVNKTIHDEQLNQIIEAILAGKYSWACFLLLRCTGYDPLHYIPYRTYNRLVKENCQIPKQNAVNTNHLNSNSRYSQFSADSTPAHQQTSKITDLDFLEVERKQNTRLRGGDAGESGDLNSAGFDSMIQRVRSIFNYN